MTFLTMCLLALALGLNALIRYHDGRFYADYDHFGAESLGVVVPSDFSTIQEAINDADEGDTVFVRSGYYYENVVVNKIVSLIGEDKESTVLNGTVIEAPIIIVEANDVQISGFTFEGWAFQDILVNATAGVLIVENRIVFNAVGIDVENSVNITIENNIINGFGLDNIGIMLAHSSGCHITENTITNAIFDGVRLWSSLAGDVNNDGTVGLSDLVLLADAYGSGPEDLTWNPYADFDRNFIVGLTDLVNLATHYGQHYS